MSPITYEAPLSCFLPECQEGHQGYNLSHVYIAAGICPPLPTKAHTVASSLNASKDSVVTITCETGYMFKGATASTGRAYDVHCDANLQWAGITDVPQCQGLMN